MIGAMQEWPRSPLHLNIHLGNDVIGLAGIFEMKVILMTSSTVSIPKITAPQ